LLETEGDVSQGLLALMAEFLLEIFVVAEPAAEGAFADLGFLGGGDDGAGLEQGGKGAVLGGGML
jgi:hypothetical protein